MRVVMNHSTWSDVDGGRESKKQEEGLGEKRHQEGKEVRNRKIVSEKRDIRKAKKVRNRKKV